MRGDFIYYFHPPTSESPAKPGCCSLGAPPGSTESALAPAVLEAGTAPRRPHARPGSYLCRLRPVKGHTLLRRASKGTLFKDLPALGQAGRHWPFAPVSQARHQDAKSLKNFPVVAGVALDPGLGLGTSVPISPLFFLLHGNPTFCLRLRGWGGWSPEE